MLSPVHPLIKLLLEVGAIDPDLELPPYLGVGEGPIQFYSKSGVVEEKRAIEVISQRFSFPYYDLNDPSVYSHVSLESLPSGVSSERCVELKFVPLGHDGNSVTVAFANPLDRDTVRAAEFLLGKPVKIGIAEEQKILQVLGHRSVVGGDISDVSEEQIEVVSIELDDQPIDIERSGTPHIVRITNKIIADAVRNESSDIHIEPTDDGLAVRYRTDGVMQNILELPKRLQPYILSRFKLLGKMDIAEKRRPQDGRIRVKVLGELVDLRISSIPVSYGEKIVLRILRNETRDLSFSALGFAPALQDKLAKVLSFKGKLILVTGPTGSGKTTTLYSCLNYLRDGASNIQTVEDPVEFRMQGISQVQVNDAIGVTFASALRSILRQDPDIIMIGEIRDAETALTALQAAQTGHLVLSTLHTNSAPEAVARLLNLGISPYIVASSLAAVMFQRLVRRVCPGCSQEVGEEYVDRNQEIFRLCRFKQSGLREGKGCAKCNHTGYKGRLGITSFLEVNDPIRELILARAGIPQIVMEAKRHGYLDISESAQQLVRAGITTIDEIRPYLQTERLLEEETKVQQEQVQMSEDAESPSARLKRRKNEGKATGAPQPHYSPPYAAPRSQGAAPQPVPPYGYEQQYLQGVPPQQPYAPQQYAPPVYVAPPQPSYPAYQQPAPFQPTFPPPQPAVPYGAQQPVQGFPPYQAPQAGYQVGAYGVPPYAPPQYAPPYPYPPQGGYQPQFVPPEQEGEDTVAESKGIERRRVLLVEDNRDMRKIMTAALEREMFEVFEAQNGVEGYNAVYSHCPDIVLCDLMMPVLDGKGFLLKMQSDQDTRDIPVIFLTASDTDDNEVELLTLGARDFISKLSPAHVVIARIRRILAQR